MAKFGILLSAGFAVLALSTIARADLGTYSRTDAAAVLREVSADLTLKTRLGQPLTLEHGEWMGKWLKEYRKDSRLVPSNFAADGSLFKPISSFFGRWFHHSQQLAEIASPTTSASISDAPFLDFILAAQGSSLYQSAYTSQYNTVYTQYTTQTPLDLIFDTLIGKIVDGSASQTPGLADTAKQIGKCLASKVDKGKDDAGGCSLNMDESDLPTPSIVQLALAKGTCFLTIPTPCWARKVVFNAAKKQLIDARKDPAIHAQIVEAVNGMLPLEFPKVFNSKFFDTLDGVRADIRKFIGNKTGSADNLLWDKDAALVETNDRNSHDMTLHDFAKGLDADVLAAQLLAISSDAHQRSFAPPLLFAAANKLLVLMGGKRAKFENKHYTSVRDTVQNESNPANASVALSTPAFDQLPFGGIGVNFSSGTPTAAVWDWGGYSPSSHWEAFPALFTLDDHLNVGLPSAQVPYETIDDVADLLGSSLDFYKATAPGQPLGQYFGDAASILDSSSSVIFPVEGRMVAIGTLAGLLQNSVSSTFGHVAKIDNSGNGGAVQISFNDRVTQTGQVGNPVAVASIANMMERAIDLNDALAGDPNVPAKLADQLPQLKDAIFLGTMGLLLSHGQAPDGGFYEYLDNAGAAPRTLHTQIQALQLMLRYYEVSGIPVLRLNIQDAFKNLSTYFASGAVIPASVEGSTGKLVPVAELWRLVQVWDEMQIVLGLNDGLHAGVSWDFDYPTWSQRFQNLEQRLNAQLISGELSDLPEQSL